MQRHHRILLSSSSPTCCYRPLRAATSRQRRTNPMTHTFSLGTARGHRTTSTRCMHPPIHAIATSSLTGRMHRNSQTSHTRGPEGSADPAHQRHGGILRQVLLALCVYFSSFTILYQLCISFQAFQQTIEQIREERRKSAVLGKEQFCYSPHPNIEMKYPPMTDHVTFSMGS
jgi:hypothetical protein